MVDFEKLRKDRGVSKSIDPIEIFRRLPKTSKINDLWNSQAEALREWNLRRKDKDIVLKLNTGGGKTLVGLIIAQSIANETDGPTMYLCPTVQLTEQIYNFSKEYGFKTSIYKKGSSLDADFLSGKHIMIATYRALFNAQSKFGTTESIKDYVHLNGIIIDDAHAAFSNIRDYFILSIEKKSHPELYSELCTLFRNDFMKLNKAGTFDDIVNRSDPSILEVPYWGWKQRSDQIREKLAETISDTPPFVFTWPLIRDEFDYCHALISYRSFSITPLYPLVDKFPSFSKCPRRVYMSATLANDSSIIRTFDANRKSVSEPITSKSLAGVGERMILAPALMDIDPNQIENIVKQVIEKISTNAGVLILVPSNKDLKIWMDIATVPRESKDVKEYVDKLRNKKVGAYAFSNRYDGLDLPDDSCRLLVMAGRPSGDNIYDSFRHRVLKNSRVINTALAQRIEQGIGRGTRGSGDYCVVILLENKLISWTSMFSNLELLTPSTRAQLEMGNEISKNVSSLQEFEETINKCLNRNISWVEYHADSLAELTDPIQPDVDSLEIAESERKYFKHIRDGYYDKAISVLSEYDNEDIDEHFRGWLVQLCARASYYWGNESQATEFQKHTYSLNKSLLRPQVEPPYVSLSNLGDQSRAIVEPILEYKQRKGYLAQFDEIKSQLNPIATTNQFEESLKRFGSILGFQTQRPEKEEFIKKGPDVLWILDENKALIIEAKSRKKQDNKLNKDEFGQVLTSYEWFKDKYPRYQGIKVVVHPNNYTTDSILASDTYALTMDNLSAMLSNAGILISELCKSTAPSETLIAKCESGIKELKLTPEGIVERFLTPFESSVE